MRFQLRAAAPRTAGDCLIFSEHMPKKSVHMLSEFQHPAAHQWTLLRLHQDPFTLWIRDLGGKLVYDAKCKRKGKKLLFQTSVRKMPEQIFKQSTSEIFYPYPKSSQKNFWNYSGHIWIISLHFRDLGRGLQCLIQASSGLTAFSWKPASWQPFPAHMAFDVCHFNILTFLWETLSWKVTTCLSSWLAATQAWEA